MTVPQINPEAIAEGNLGVQMALTALQQTMSKPKLALFLDLVPERGEKLWGKFRAFQQTAGDVGFTEFVKKTITSDPVMLFYPKGCSLDKMTRGLLVSEVQRSLQGKIRSDDDVMNIYFGVGDQYQAVREVACKGCPMSKCQHWVNPHGRRN